MQANGIGAATPATASGLFHEPSPNGEVAPPPSLPLPGVPPRPANFVAPDAARGADALED